ncbi:MAG: hypothetical protein ACI4RB_06820 [Acutalibacteraceae bacterium]
MDKRTQDLFNILNSKTEDEQKKLAMDMLSRMDSSQSQAVKNIIGDEEKIKQILSSPQAQQLIQKLKGK